MEQVQNGLNLLAPSIKVTPQRGKGSGLEQVMLRLKAFLAGQYSAGYIIFAFFVQENAVSAAERRAIINNENRTQVWISDLVSVIPSLTGKIELLYEGEQEGPYQVSVNLIDKSIRTLFVQYFPNPEQAKKKKAVGKKSVDEKPEENPYKQITRWFDSGNSLDLLIDMKDEEKIEALYKVDGLFGLVKKHFHAATDNENALLMEFVLHGLSTYSLISKKVIEGKIEFKDLMNSMMNLNTMNFNDDELEEDDFR